MPAVSKKQRIAAAIAEHHPEKATGAAKQMARSMSKEQLHHFADTPTKGLPARIKKGSDGMDSTKQAAGLDKAKKVIKVMGIARPSEHAFDKFWERQTNRRVAINGRNGKHLAKVPDVVGKKAEAAIDVNTLSNSDLAYIEGFIQKCAEFNLDPEEVLVKLAQDSDEKDEKKKHSVKHVAGGVGKGALGGAAIGGTLGALAGGVSAGAASAKYNHKHNIDKIKQVLKDATRGAGTFGTLGALSGAGTGAVAGGVSRIVS